MRYLSCVYVSLRDTPRRVWPPAVAPMPHRLAAAPVPAPHVRGIYRVREDVMGRPAYYAVTSRGEITEPCRARDGETNREIIALLAKRLAVIDPVRPQLTVVGGGRSRPSSGLAGFAPPPLQLRR